MGEVAAGQGVHPYEVLQRIRQRIAEAKRWRADPVATFASLCADVELFKATAQSTVRWDPFAASLVDALAEAMALADELAELVNAHRAVESHDAVQPTIEPVAALGTRSECGGPHCSAFPVDQSGL